MLAVAENRFSTQSSRLYLLYNRRYCRSKLYIAITENCAFLRKSGKYKQLLFEPQKLLQILPKHISGQLSTVLACMLPELHAMKIPFFADLILSTVAGSF